MTKEIKKSMRNGLDKTQIALVFVTREYETRVNQVAESPAKFEFYHIAENFQACNAIIPIICEEEMSIQSAWKGYLKGTIGHTTAIDFSDAWEDEAVFAQRCTDLLFLIRSILKRLRDEGGRQVANENMQKKADSEATKRGSLLSALIAVVEDSTNVVDLEAPVEYAQPTGQSSIELTENPLHQQQRPSCTSRPPFFGQTKASGGGGVRDLIPKKTS